MIVKSSSRKDTSFEQLVQYLHKEEMEGKEHDHVFTYLHNIEGNDLTHKDIAAKFKSNDVFRKKRRGGVAMYHEFLSFAPEDTSKINKDILEDMTRQYIEHRAPNALAIARPEFDKNHIHIHFMISGNERGSNKVTRLSKSEFAKVKKQMQTYQQKRYKFLSSYVDDRDKTKYQEQHIVKQTNQERQMKERGVSMTKKQKREKEITGIFQKSEQLSDFIDSLKKSGYRTYGRNGKVEGIYIKDGKQKRRLSTFFKSQPKEVYDRYVELQQTDDKRRAIREKVQDFEKKNPHIYQKPPTKGKSRKR